MPWKVDLKSRSFTRRAVHPYISVTLLHHAIHGRETEARALAHPLGGKERLENVCDGLGTHAGPRVRDREHHVTPFLRAGVIAPVCVAELNVGGLDLVVTPRRPCLP